MDDQTTETDDIQARNVPESQPAMPRAAPVRRRTGRHLAAALALAGLALAGLAWIIFHPQPMPQRSGGPRLGISGAVPVVAAAVEKGDVRVTLTGLGTVTPLATITVKTQINGQLTQIAFKEGQIVRQNDFLAQIDPRPYEAALHQAEGQLLHDQALLEGAKVDLARYKTLLRQDSIARQQYEDQVYLVGQYEGTVKVDQAQVENAKLNLVYCHIVSPVTGRVGIRMVDEGNYVQTGDPGLVVVTQIEPISVIFVLPEDDLPAILRRVHAGAVLPVTAFDRSHSTELATGTLTALDSQIDPTTGTVKLRAQFDNKDGSLFPNQFVNAQLLVDTLHDAIVVPVAAIQRGAPGTFVYLMDADDTVKVRPVKLGPADGNHVAAEEGLAPGDKVVVDGADKLRDGARAEIIVPGTKGGPGKAGRLHPDGSGKPHANRGSAE